MNSNYSFAKLEKLHTDGVISDEAWAFLTENAIRRAGCATCLPDTVAIIQAADIEVHFGISLAAAKNDQRPVREV